MTKSVAEDRMRRHGKGSAFRLKGESGIEEKGWGLVALAMEGGAMKAGGMNWEQAGKAQRK